MAGNVHDKIIIRTAKDVLVPMGLFQKGQSRTWIDDNGWFLTIVEFQSNDWGKGSHLHVGLHYLWENSDSLSIDYGDRERGFISFTGDADKFSKEMLEQAALAKEKVLYYRSFSKLSLARKKILEIIIQSPRNTWDRMMICFLSSDWEHGRNFYNQAVKETKDDFRESAMAVQDLVTHKIAPILSNHEKLEEFVIASVRESRCILREKSSMKKLAVDEKFG